MMKFKNIFLGLCIAAASLNTFAQQSDEHKDHHPEKTAPSAVTIMQSMMQMMMDCMPPSATK